MIAYNLEICTTSLGRLHGESKSTDSPPNPKKANRGRSSGHRCGYAIKVETRESPSFVLFPQAVT